MTRGAPRRARRGVLITFEGTEGSGKTTHIRRLARDLTQKRYPVVCTREPGGTRLAELIRRIFLTTGTAVTPLAELFLIQAARAQHVQEVILPHLRQGGIVLCDRFTDATIAYQGYGRGLPRAVIARLNRIAAAGLTPALTILIDAPLRRALASAQRTSRHGQGDRIEQEHLNFHRRVRAGYLAQQRRAPRRVRRIMQRQRVRDTYRLVRALVAKLLVRRGYPV